MGIVKGSSLTVPSWLGEGVYLIQLIHQNRFSPGAVQTGEFKHA